MGTAGRVLTRYFMPCIYYPLTIPIIKGSYRTSTRQQTERNDEGKERIVSVGTIDIKINVTKYDKCIFTISKCHPGLIGGKATHQKAKLAFLANGTDSSVIEVHTSLEILADCRTCFTFKKLSC